MIDKIKKVKNLGIFSDYSCPASLPAFKKYNVIYGWNGSGKTTLSKLFDSLENGSHVDYGELEYEVDSGSDRFKNAEIFNRKVRVFNQDYVQNNISVLESRAKAISIILGEESKETLEEIASDEKVLNGDPQDSSSTGKIKAFKKAEGDKVIKTKERDSAFTDIARLIGASIGGEAIRSYNSRQAKAKFDTLSAEEMLTDTELEKATLVLKQKEEPVIAKLSRPLYAAEPEEAEGDVFEKMEVVLSNVKTVLERTVESRVISRLKEHPQISNWVETGLHLHDNHASEACEFCGGALTAERLKMLAGHFSLEDKNIKRDIDGLILQSKRLYDCIDSVGLVDRARFYDDFREDFDAESERFEACSNALLGEIDAIIGLLREKKLKTTDRVEFHAMVDPLPFLSSMEAINGYIDAHNAKIGTLSKEKDAAKARLEIHHLSSIFDKVKGIEEKLRLIDCELQSLKDGDSSVSGDIGIEALKSRIAANRAKISTSHKACEKLNVGLATFLGRNDLAFEPNTIITKSEDGEEKAIEQGYLIKRKGIVARHLSEGEKTAIAFVYFTVHLNDSDFSLSEGIVVIDDPISSLDSNSLFQAFAFLKNAIKGAHQVFVLTHNFDFLKLLLNWVKNIRPKQNDRNYFMLVNNFDADSNRVAGIRVLDQTLFNHESEYHFLFKTLLNFQSDGTILSVYHIPNVARKVLDTFLMFRVPNSDSLYTKLDSLNFDENKKTAIYKFTNDQSHITGGGFDPSLVQETQNNVKALLEMMNAVFPEHYEILIKSLSPAVA